MGTQFAYIARQSSNVLGLDGVVLPAPLRLFCIKICSLPVMKVSIECARDLLEGALRLHAIHQRWR
jgi:hypothetical protein